MQKILWLCLTILLLVLCGEIVYLFVFTKQIQKISPIRNVLKQEQQENTTTDRVSWKADKVGMVNGKEYGNVYILLGKVTKFINEKQFEAVDIDGKKYYFSITPSTKFSSIQLRADEGAYTYEEGKVFIPEKNQVYLLQWLKNDNGENNTIIKLWQISKRHNT